MLQTWVAVSQDSALKPQEHVEPLLEPEPHHVGIEGTLGTLGELEPEEGAREACKL
jgi:hypothetical protein